MNRQEEIKEHFLKRTKNHSMEVKLDNEIYRHLVFSKNGSYNDRFELITYPRYLTIVGDMGSYTFSRVEDMFRFFRRDELKINSSYWAEKCQCNGRYRDFLKEWSDESFKESVNYQAENWAEDMEEEEREEFLSEVKSEVLAYSDDEFIAIRKAMNFEFNKALPFQDFWEVDATIYRYHFLWCLYAIVWGIQQYDESKLLIEA